jgi:hypothetical protein
MTENLHGCTAILLGPEEEVRSQAEVAWDALHASLRESLPPCADRALFTADRLSEEQRDECASICATCPVASVCDAYAVAARVQSGFWAGYLYSPKGRTTASGGSRQSTERQDHE